MKNYYSFNISDISIFLQSRNNFVKIVYEFSKKLRSTKRLMMKNLTCYSTPPMLPSPNPFYLVSLLFFSAGFSCVCFFYIYIYVNSYLITVIIDFQLWGMNMWFPSLTNQASCELSQYCSGHLLVKIIFIWLCLGNISMLYLHFCSSSINWILIAFLLALHHLSIIFPHLDI